MTPRGHQRLPAMRFALLRVGVCCVLMAAAHAALAQTAAFRAPETVVPANAFEAVPADEGEVGRFPEEVVEPVAPAPLTAPAPVQPPVAPIPSPPERLLAQPAGPPTFPGPEVNYAPPMQGPYGQGPSLCDRVGYCLFGWMCDCDEWFVHSDPDDPQRAVGYGEPLAGTSWLNRPYWVGAFGGMLLTDSPMDTAYLANDFILGLSVGHDFDHYYGAQFRIAGGSYSLIGSPFGSADNIAFVDFSLLHYPWGDARWRPYYSFGLGTVQQHFLANDGIAYHDWLFNIPLGVGLKYQCTPHCVLRFEVTNNISFGGGDYGLMDNIAFVGGLEYHFGGGRPSYFPWNPSVTLD